MITIGIDPHKSSLTAVAVDASRVDGYDPGHGDGDDGGPPRLAGHGRVRDDSPGGPHRAQRRHQRPPRDAAEIGDGIGLIVKLPRRCAGRPGC